MLPLLAALLMPAAARATIAPAVTISPTSVPAGSTQSLTVNVNVSPSLGDYPTSLTLGFPPGLLLNANLDNGICLNSATPQSGCELGTGLATAGIVAPVPVTLWLVKGPSPLDLAGAALVLGPLASGTVAVTGDVTLRTTPDLGLNVAFANLPSGLNGLSALNLTLTGLRAPTSCPSPPANFSATAISSQLGVPQNATAPLTVTGCGSLSYVPKLSGMIDRDTGDPGAAFIATVAGSGTGSATQAISLDVPSSVSPDPNAALRCLLGTPCVIGSASATSPLLPGTVLTNGVVNLGGNVLAPMLSVGFPPPFPVTLTGTVNTTTEALSFNNIPDIPLTKLTLDVGAGSAVKLFTTDCSAGNLSGRLTPWNGAATLSETTPITFGGSCPATPTTGSGTPTSSSGAPMLSRGSLRGVVKQTATLAFTAGEGPGAPAIKRLAIAFPKGFGLAGSRHALATGIGVRSARGKKLKFSTSVRRGILSITLSPAAASARVSIASPALTVTASFAREVRTQLRRKKVSPVRFAVTATDASGHATALGIRLRPAS